jgi:hypothetical protein
MRTMDTKNTMRRKDTVGCDGRSKMMNGTPA